VLVHGGITLQVDRRNPFREGNGQAFHRFRGYRESAG